MIYGIFSYFTFFKTSVEMKKCFHVFMKDSDVSFIPKRKNNPS